VALPFYLLAAFVLAVAVTGICPANKAPDPKAPRPKLPAWSRLAPLLLVIALLPAVGGYYSFRYTGERFLNEVTELYLGYRATVTAVEQGEDVAAAEREQTAWAETYQTFAQRYDNYRPLVIKGDAAFSDDLQTIGTTVSTVADQLADENLLGAQLTLYELRPLWSNLFRRNQLIGPELAIAAAGDTLEAMVQAGQRKHAPTVLRLYPEVELRLRAAAEQLSGERLDRLKDCQQALEQLKEAAQRGQPAALGIRSEALLAAYQAL
jgi:hypothetical protein